MDGKDSKVGDVGSDVEEVKKGKDWIRRIRDVWKGEGIGKGDGGWKMLQIDDRRKTGKGKQTGRWEQEQRKRNKQREEID